MMHDLDGWMTKNGETNDTLAVKVDVSRAQISRIRRGKSGVSVATAKRLESVTQIPAVKFVFREGAAQ